MARKNTAEKKPTARKTAAQKVAPKKTEAKKAAPKKALVTKAGSKNIAPKKTAVKKTAVKKADKPAQAEKAKPENRVKVTLVKSVIGTKASHRATVRGLGLRRIRHSVELEDTPSVRGMINKVSYLVRVEA